MQFTMKIEGLDQMQADAKSAGREMQNLLYGTMVKATTLVQNEAKRVGPDMFRNITGTLRRSIMKKVDSATRGRVYTDEIYGGFVEGGTSPHTIYPKKGRFLAFRINGKLVLARKVNHPGTKAKPFMEPALNKKQGEIQREYERVADQIARTLAGQ